MSSSPRAALRQACRACSSTSRRRPPARRTRVDQASSFQIYHLSSSTTRCPVRCTLPLPCVTHASLDSSLPLAVPRRSADYNSSPVLSDAIQICFTHNTLHASPLTPMGYRLTHRRHALSGAPAPAPRGRVEATSPVAGADHDPGRSLQARRISLATGTGAAGRPTSELRPRQSAHEPHPRGLCRLSATDGHHHLRAFARHDRDSCLP
mmetsp:Transcript_17059/g.46097  ORF Transcript_17059/g.46097 Transcript_17059/m.46097 type:complete len:208 (+) Transcript_17059:614-1237(+)